MARKLRFFTDQASSMYLNLHRCTYYFLRKCVVSYGSAFEAFWH